jgi:hypothetical protein
MTAVNHIVDGMPNSRTSAVLSAAAEVVTWKHPMETSSLERKRISQPGISASWLHPHADPIARVATHSPLQTMQFMGCAPSNNSAFAQLVPLRNLVPERVELEACEVWSVQG